MFLGLSRSVPLLFLFNLAVIAQEEPAASSQAESHGTAIHSYILGYAERWGPMVETEEFLVACTKAAVFRMRLSTGRWKVIIRPEQHPSARIKGISAGKDAVFFAGEHRENKTLRPLLWKTDLADWQLHRFPVEEALRKSGLKQFNNLSNVIPVDNKLLLAIHRGGYSGIAAELNPDNNTIKAVANPPAGDVALGFDPS
ncbi:MAG: hypothetical protein QF886_20920, partial [Planctomycetota bacterium]|nr:hypothetical protein [Planctomycetota bacterium]